MGSEKVLSITEAGLLDINIWMKYYFGTELLEWGKILFHAAQPDITVIGGSGCGKTTQVALAAAAWCAYVPGFKFMNLAPTIWQSKLMYNTVLSMAAGKPFDGLIKATRTSWYPLIQLKNGSTMEFMSAQDELERIRGWEGDWMNGDEFGYVDTFARTLQIMRTRLRGVAPGGRNRLGRLSVVTTSPLVSSNSDVVEELWGRFDRAYKSGVEVVGGEKVDYGKSLTYKGDGIEVIYNNLYLSIKARTASNKFLDPRDVYLMRTAFGDDVEAAAIELDAEKPSINRYFPQKVIMRCVDGELLRGATLAMEKGVPGYQVVVAPKLGVVRYMVPPGEQNMYLLAGDPGQGTPPARNSPVVLVFKVSSNPSREPHELVYFHWFDGRGSYRPFLADYINAYRMYKPVIATLDTTGPQKGFNELVFENHNLVIVPGDMSGTRKEVMALSLKTMLENGFLRFPNITGLVKQLIRWKPADKHLQQDIVTALMLAAFQLRPFRYEEKKPQDIKHPNREQRSRNR